MASAEFTMPSRWYNSATRRTRVNCTKSPHLRHRLQKTTRSKGVYMNVLSSRLPTNLEALAGDGSGSGPKFTAFKLTRALVRTVWWHIAVTALYALIYNLATYVGPYLIDSLVQYLNGDERYAGKGKLLVVTFIVAKVFECLSQRHWFFRLQQAGIRTRSALVSVVYQKGLSLSSSSRQSCTSGEMINIISVDADRVGLFSWYMHDPWLVPLQVGLALFILYSTLGVASLAALGATIAVMLANVPPMKMQEKFQQKLMDCKDVRMKVTSEILRNMRILKLQGWEMKFLSKINDLRTTETSWLKKYLYTWTAATFVFWGAPTFVAVATFGACMLLGIPLESGKVLSALATFRVLHRTRQSRRSGEMINIISVDADRVGLFSWYMHDPWLVPLQVGLALFILYSTLGVASLAALGATIAVMLANVPPMKMQEKFQQKLMDCKDVRMKVTSEILRNMRILKLQGWEMKFLSKINDLRTTETSWLKKYLYTWTAATFVFWGAPTFVAVATFGACMLLGIPLESGKVLSALATFRVLQEPIYNLPDTISMMIQTKVSLDRIASFLCLEEFPTDAVERLPSGSSNVAIEVSNGCFSWDGSPELPTLKDLNFQARQGMHVAVCGTVGSGKSSLLSCILGEVPKLSGEVKTCGTMAYVSQTAWIQSGKIQDNILFGKEMDSEKYDSVLEWCSLKKDLEILPFGDKTVIGERGINLSGGQKQRIQIARALYQDADIYLFDDPFSAVDAHTGSHLFKVMKGGRIAQAGKYNDILGSEEELMELVGAHQHALTALDVIDVANGGSEKLSSSLSRSLSSAEEKDKQNGKEDGDKVQSGQLVQEEEREKGRVGFWVYWKYLTLAYGGALVPFVLIAQLLFQVLQIASNYWMAWASPVSEDAEPPVSTSTLIYVFVALAVASSLCILVRALFVVTAAYKTATLLFNKMHMAIFRAPMSFFDSTPSGRILNRVAWQVFVVFVPVIIIFLCYQRYYIETARELQRLVGVCKAPIIQHFSESISGSTTIRSFGKENQFVLTNSHLIDADSRPKFYNAAAMEWLCFRLDTLSSFTFAFALIFLISLPTGIIDPGIAGLAVTYGLNLNMLQAWVVRSMCNLENKIVSVERILQYISIPEEPPLSTSGDKLPHNWPSEGEIQLRNLHVRYAPQLPFVLKGLSVTFPGGMKTGIVGRTGSGKSTLIQVLFRIVEPTVGQILVDGVDICTIGLHDLRSRLSIIPQDPTMFEGTVRSNLDPLNEYNDDQIWEALDNCQLGDEVRKKELKLDSPVIENGENWSVGQRQLVCLGRVILKRTKILVLDEATASVDTATDNMIQRTLRENFSEATVITIAHRITSVLDSDMVLLLDDGVAVERDTPAKLLEDKSSLFSKLVAEYTMRATHT
ncbi:ABC transporter C family member 3 [Triticum urartu]|uniref:ABC transporter C family member 3 n=1 Tax=Triticum urartu TaxID=4572 RepID=M7ZSS2_TRIUA|nr:ABC transporter C family member 3 [Triticum urartu]